MSQYFDIFNILNPDGSVNTGNLELVLPRIASALAGSQKGEGRQVGLSSRKLTQTGVIQTGGCTSMPAQRYLNFTATPRTRAV